MTSSNTDQLLFLPLGGAGEIGMNLNLYGYGQPEHAQWIMIDLGVTFSDPTYPGVDVMMPDPAFIEEHVDDLCGIVLTHAHEDHLGAVQHLWPRLRCPVYVTPFAASVLNRKLQEVDWADDVPIHVQPLGSRFALGPFDLELITLTHSIPEPNAIAIKTPKGTVLHTGDWKFDPDPVVGSSADSERLKQIGDQGILAMICDSTNVFAPGDSGSEGDLQDSLERVIAGCTGRVAVGCFASNVARIQTIWNAAGANDRDVVLVGRSLYRMVESAKETGYLPEKMTFVSESDAGFLPRDKCLYICTGSQGEPRAALWRIACDDHPKVGLDDGDTVVFSSRVIPGNEVSISRLQNRLAARNINVITWQDAFVHVSGHPARDELIEMYQLARPQVAVPVHGEIRHMIAHANLARDCQVPQACVVENGTMLSLDATETRVVDQVPSGRLALEGNRLVPLDGSLLSSRKRTLYQGFVVATVVFDRDGNLSEIPRIASTGVFEVGEYDLERAVLDTVEECIDRMSEKIRYDDVQAAETIRLALRRFFQSNLGKKPTTTVHLVRP